MRKALVTLAVLAGCSRAADRQRACEHYQTLMDRNVAAFNSNVDARYQTHDTPAKRQAQIDHCVGEMKQLRVDPACVLAAKAADVAYACFDAAQPTLPR